MGSEDDWEAWFRDYERFIVHYALLAERHGIEALCIGTELSKTVHREEQWRLVIDRVRSVYGGWITYAANWNAFEDIPFWDAVDAIGIQAYFPLAKEPTSDEEVLIAGWAPWLEKLERIHLNTGKEVIFTELGYRTNANAAVDPWLWEREVKGGGDRLGLRTQSACYEAFFSAVWNRDWLAGAYFWKWYPDHNSTGGDRGNGFTPQNKPAQRVLAEWFRATAAAQSVEYGPIPSKN